jgi:hypothetical protein
MDRNEEVKRRVLAWEQKNGKKLKDCSESEWIEAAQTILALTRFEAEEYLSYLQGISQSLSTK